MEKIVLAYSGGLDTSIIISWLRETYNYEVIAVTADLGQGRELQSIEAQAVRSGAAKVYIMDVRREFVEDYIFPTLRAGALYEGKYLLGTSMSRPLIAKKLVEVCAREGAVAVAHGATGKGNDQVRFELAIKALDPDLKIVAPWRRWDIRSREDAIDYAVARGITVPVTRERPYSIDRNIWHVSHEGGDLEDPALEPPAGLFMFSVAPEKAPDKPTYVEIGFEAGVPVTFDGRELDPVTMLETLNEVGGANGIGIVDMVENRLVGMKSRGVYETPGGTVLWLAQRELERLTLDRITMHFKEMVAARYAEIIYDGVWFSPLREALDAFVNVIQRRVTGKVKMKLYKGNCTPAGAVSPYSLYNKEFVTFGLEQIYNHKDAEGFINLFGLPLKIQALMEKQCGLR